MREVTITIEIIATFDAINYNGPTLCIGSLHRLSDAVNTTLVLGKNVVTAKIAVAAFDQIHIIFKERHSLDTNLEIMSVALDDINLQHFLYNMPYYPCCDEHFVEKYNPPVYYTPGTQLNQLGVFVIDIALPIWKMIMEMHCNEL